MRKLVFPHILQFLDVLRWRKNLTSSFFLRKYTTSI